MSTLGKRKDREEDADKTFAHGSTLFVSNLPYTATSVDLQTLFSDIAPVRSAFVVTEKGSGVSKGVGYVSFAIKEDAQAAFTNISSEGLQLDRRSLRVQWADSKPKVGNEETEKKEPKPKATPSHRPITHKPSAADPLAIRTVVISGLPPSIDSKTLWKKIRKYEGAESILWPLKGDDEEEDPSSAHALFKNAASAQEAVTKLHAHVFKGSLLSVTLKKRLEGLAKLSSQKPTKPSTAARTDVVKKPAPSRASRLIVRNLPFNITEQDLRAVFLPHGPIHSIDIPLKPDENPDDMEDGEQEVKKEAKNKGFAFVWMLSKKDAEKAVEGCNGIKLRPGMAQSLVLDKQKKKKVRREEEKARKRIESGGVDGAEDLDHAKDGPEERGEVEKPLKGVERVIAVDWALSKNKWEEEKAKVAQVEDVEEGESLGSESEGEDSSGDGSDDDHIGVHDDNSSEEGSASEDEGGSGEDDDMDVDADEQEPVKPQLPPPEAGTTLFVRNVPYEATDDELRTLFRTFGPLRYARVTMDHSTGRSRGTGFACFWNKEDADKAIQQSDILRMETMGNEGPQKNPFKFSSILTPDPSAAIAQSLVLHGRTLDVSRAVTRDEAGKLKEAAEKRREKADKRNMYLLREGIILPSTPAAASLSTKEVEKRTSSFNARRKLLQSNPSLFVSRTRLSVRQIPLFVTERSLRRLAAHAVRQFEKEVKEGVRSGLTEDELTEPTHEEEEGNKDVKGKSKEKEKPKPPMKDSKKNSLVKQAKVVRQQERVDPITGKGRSKGYGFLELETHPDALRVLRWANNNPDVTPLFEEWWKSELENLIKVEKAKKETGDVAQLQRLENELEKGVAGKGKGTLIIEFSIENIQVVQRRATRQQDAKDPTSDRRPTKKLTLPKKDKPEERSPKKRRTSEVDSKPQSGTKESPASHPAGSIIGRKRKQKRIAKKGGS
ncbi:hypothetical protein JAAARDRAFT_37540 [Jaapia argillacea MUCL 33604]|uniref:RRM domain-containing protein n=1 Tax=Jaapia argillacea MUCL 33604 TaxID=933084 RepID=A0A067PNY5_9AGAM|nr:hypothetical protein JAAARDRAFT_37540 [Jaapia argillacea MUCL 33604]